MELNTDLVRTDHALLVALGAVAAKAIDYLVTRRSTSVKMLDDERHAVNANMSVLINGLLAQVKALQEEVRGLRDQIEEYQVRHTEDGRRIDELRTLLAQNIVERPAPNANM